MSTTWSTRLLSEIFGRPVSAEEIEYSHLNELVDLGVSESITIDFKRKYGAPAKPDVQRDFACDVAAFANARGGVIVIGVLETDGVASGLSPLQGSAEAEEQRLRSELRIYAYPVPDCRFVSIPDPGMSDGFFLFVLIPPGSHRPYCVLEKPNGRGRHAYPERDGADNRWLTPHEVSERFSQRAQMDSLTGQSKTHLELSLQQLDRWGKGHLWLYYTIVPEYLASSRFSPDSSAAAIAWAEAFDFSTPGQAVMRLDIPVRRPGRVSYMQFNGEDQMVAPGMFVDLFSNGSAVVAVDLLRRVKDIGGVQCLDQIILAEYVVLFSEFVLSWATRQVGVFGPAVASVGYRGAIEIGVCRTIPNFGPERIERTLTVSPPLDCEVGVDLAALVGTQDRLSAGANVLRELLGQFGLVEEHFLRTDGSLVPGHWGGQGAIWANRHGVSILA